MTSKVVGYGQTIWNHKKKIIFFGGLASWGVSYLIGLNNEQILRSSYAKKAALIGSSPIGSMTSNSGDYIPPKIHVFINKSDSLYHKNLASFNKNVLPLLLLSGFDVLVKDAKNIEDLKSLSDKADVRSCAGLVLIGSTKFDVPHVLSGLFINKSVGGINEARTSLAVFDPADRDDVEGRCKKAMRIINSQRQLQHVYSTKVYVKDSEDLTKEKQHPESNVLRIADTNFGWVDFCQEKERKFWWFGGLSQRMAFTWYFLKRYPQPFPINATIVSYCNGCRKCVTEVSHSKIEETHQTRWWQGWIGRREQPGDQQRRKYAQVVNEECGRKEELRLDSVELDVQNLNKGVYGGLVLRSIDSFDNRWQAIWTIWTKWNNKESPANLFVEKSKAKCIELKLEDHLSEQVKQAIGLQEISRLVDEEAEITKIVIETLPNVIQMY